MDLKDQVVNLELSKKLKELGVKQKSLWWWTDYKQNGDYRLNYNLGIASTHSLSISAFTVAELGEMLPNRILSSNNWEDNGKWRTQDFMEPAKNQEMQYADTEANARAKMLIYLIESGKIWNKD